MHSLRGVDPPRPDLCPHRQQRRLRRQGQLRQTVATVQHFGQFAPLQKGDVSIPPQGLYRQLLRRIQGLLDRRQDVGGVRKAETPRRRKKHQKVVFCSLVNVFFRKKKEKKIINT